MKNVSLKVMAVVLAILMITVCFASTTVSYYETKFTGSSKTAVVAKWSLGDTVTTIFDPFAVSYAKSSQTIVSSANYVVAPGASNSCNITLDGLTEAPEVNYNVKVEAVITGSSALLAKIEWKDGNNWSTKTSGSSISIADYDFWAGEKPDLTDADALQWRWNEGEGCTGDATVSSDAIIGSEFGNDVTVTIKVTARQIFTEPTK